MTSERGDRMARALECNLVHGLAPWRRSQGDRALEMVDQQLWRKRYAGRHGVSGASGASGVRGLAALAVLAMLAELGAG